MDAMDSGDESYNESISTEMLEDIHDISQSHPSVNRRQARYKYLVESNKDNCNRKES